MKGLEISRRFFLEWGLPFLQQHFPRLTTRVAAGKIGGSDCLGADDAISRDHDWGPLFMLWLDQDDHRDYASAVRQKIDEAAPDSFLGYSRPDNSYVAEIHSRIEYFDHHVGIHVPPESGSEWMPDAYAEEMLYDITHGSIYYDPTGRLNSLRQGFAAFARDPIFRLRRLVDTCFGVWHYGEYNFCERLVHREDAVSLHVCLAKFIENVIRRRSRNGTSDRAKGSLTLSSPERQRRRVPVVVLRSSSRAKQGNHAVCLSPAQAERSDEVVRGHHR